MNNQKQISGQFPQFYKNKRIVLDTPNEQINKQR